MKHYPHHIGDFDKATRHLSRLERSVYRDLIDLYYDTEKPLSLNKQSLCRRIIARSDEESTAVEQVLTEFFTETPAGWYHERCEEELDAYRANTSQKAMAGKASAAAKQQKKQQALNGKSTAVEQPLKSVATADNGASTNHQPVNQSTINHQPIYSVTDVTAVDGIPAELTKAELWTAGKSLLAAQGMPLAQCGSFVGKLVKDHGELIVVDAVRAAVVQRPADAAQYLVAACRHSAGLRKPINKQEALEARNRQVAEEMIAERAEKGSHQ